MDPGPKALLADRGCRRPLKAMLALVLQYRSNRPPPHHLRAVACCSRDSVP